MLKNILIVILAVGLVGAAVFALQERSKLKAAEAKMMSSQSGQQQRRPPMFLQKGDKLSDNPVSKYAYQIAPGELSNDAKAALVGWTVTPKTNADGSITVNLTPKDSDDQAQVYTVKSGDILYFVEMTPVDDHADKDTDSNLRDDYGIITDANGIVQ